MVLSDRNKILNDEQRRQRNNPQIKIDNAENSLFPKKNEMYNDKELLQRFTNFIMKRFLRFI